MNVGVWALLAGAQLLWATSAFAGAQDFRLVNETGYQIDYVYVSPVRSESWEEDIMGEDALPHGEAVDISFPDYGDECLWDLLAIYEDGEQVVWNGLNLCSVRKVTLFYSSSDGTTTAVTE